VKALKKSENNLQLNFFNLNFNIMRLVLNLLVVVLALGSLQSCVSKKKFNELLASKEAADKALAETQAKVKSLEADNATLKSSMEAEKARMNGEIASLRKDLDATKSQVAAVQSKLDMTSAELTKVKSEINGIFANYKSSGLGLEEKDGRLYITTGQPVSFGSAAYALTKSQKSAIVQLATTLKSNPKLKVLVEGNTDTDKVSKGSALGDNWQLSSYRALAVCRELVKNGVNPAQVAAVGRGDTMPKGDNSTKAGKATNRRTEVVADPDLNGLLQAAKQ
jgi:chemotaxis protein MotB